MSNIQVGDTVKVRAESCATLHRWSSLRGLGIFNGEEDQLHKVIEVTPFNLRVQGMTPDTGWNIVRFEKVEVTAVPNSAPSVSPFVNARQAAWDRYQDTRRKQGAATYIDGPVRKYHDHAFEAGMLHGINQTKAQQAAQTTIALARHNDPATSKAAANGVKAGKLKDLVLGALALRPMTGKEIALHTGRALNSITPRFAPLHRAGLIHVYAGRGGETVWKLGNGVLSN